MQVLGLYNVNVSHHMSPIEMNMSSPCHHIKDEMKIIEENDKY
jgi:hypothetical protein